MENRYYTDDEIYRLGYDSRASFNRRMAAEAAQAKRDAERQANFTTGQERNGSRFYEGGEPMTKVRWKRELDAQREAEIQRQYTAWKQAGEFSTQPGRTIAANLGNYLGATVRNGQAFSDWLRSSETAQKYGTTN